MLLNVPSLTLLHVSSDLAPICWKWFHAVELSQVCKAKPLSPLVFLAILLLVSGCGSTHHHFVYAVGTNSESVLGFEEASGGVLSKISGSPFSTGSVPTAIAVTPSRAYAYVLSSGGNGILTYTFDKSKGGLVAAAGAVATGSDPVAIAIDPSSQHVYVLNQSSSNISAYAIDAFTGSLSPISGSPFASINAPKSMAMSDKGDILYVASPTQGLASFSIKSNGALSPAQAAIVAGTSPAFVAVTANNRFAYVADAAGNAVVGFNAAGSSITPISNGTFATGTKPVALADAEGKFLFVANQGSNNISAFAIGSGGALTEVVGSPFAAGAAPTFLIVNHDGDHLYVADRDSGDIENFSISGSGSLISASGSPITIGVSAVWIAATD